MQIWRREHKEGEGQGNRWCTDHVALERIDSTCFGLISAGKEKYFHLPKLGEIQLGDREDQQIEVTFMMCATNVYKIELWHEHKVHCNIHVWLLPTVQTSRFVKKGCQS